MTPKKIKRAAELLDALEGLIEVRDCPGEKCEAIQLSAAYDLSPEGNCRLASRVYLPPDFGKQMIEHAIGFATAELQLLGVELPR